MQCLGTQGKQMQFEPKAQCEGAVKGRRGLQKRQHCPTPLSCRFEQISEKAPSPLLLSSPLLGRPTGMGSFCLKVTPRQKPMMRKRKC